MWVGSFKKYRFTYRSTIDVAAGFRIYNVVEQEYFLKLKTISFQAGESYRSRELFRRKLGSLSDQTAESRRLLLVLHYELVPLRGGVG